MLPRMTDPASTPPGRGAAQGQQDPSGADRRRRWLLRAAAVLLAVYALYLLAANVFLNTSIGAHAINRRPERFSAQWGWAMSLYPGHIYARELVLRGRVRTIEWRAAGSAAHGRIQLLPLLRRQLRFGTIHGGTVAVDVDTGRPPMPPTPRTGAARQRKPWELIFDGIRSRDVRHLRLGEWAVEGEGEARFAFYKRIAGGPMEIPASEFHMRKATLHQGEALWADNARLDLDLAIARHVPAQAPGLRKLALTRARLRLAGDAPALEIDEQADGGLQLRRAGRGGRLVADLTLDRGQLAPGGRLEAHLPLIIDGARSAQQDYAVDARVDVRDDGTALRIRVPRQQRSGNRIDADLLLPVRTVRPHDLSKLLARAQGRVDLQWHFGSLAWLNPLLSEGWLRLDGAADVRADLRIADGRVLDGSTAAIPRADLEADVQDNLITGSAAAQAKAEGGRVRVDLDAQRFAIAAADARARPFVRGSDLRLQLDSTADLARFREAVRARLRFENAQIPDLRAYNRYLPAGSVALLGGSGTLGGDLSLDPQGRPERARIRIVGQRAAMRVGVSRITGDLSLDSALHRTAARDYAVDALSLRLAQVRLASSPEDGPWWADVSLRGGRFGWQVPFKLDGDARLRIKDVSILLALFAERSAFPKWIGKLIDEGQVQATSRVRVDGRSVVLDRLQASNERVELRARLRLAGDRPDGDLYARWGILGMGVELDGGKRDLHMVGAKRWYDSRPPLIR